MSSVSNTIRDAAKDAKDAGREAGQAASAGARDIQADLLGLRDDVARLTHQIADIFAGTASWQRAKSDLDGVISDAGEKGREAIGVVREVGDNVVDAVDKSLKLETIHRARARRRPRLPVRRDVEFGFSEREIAADSWPARRICRARSERTLAADCARYDNLRRAI
jgi:hypothetical protein